jgi:hypothetical protein
VVGRSTEPAPTTDWMSRTITTLMRRAGRYRVSRPVLFKRRAALNCFNEVTKFCYLLSQSIGSVLGEYQLVILDSVGDGMRYGYGDVSAALCATVDDFDVLITSSNSVPVI